MVTTVAVQVDDCGPEVSEEIFLEEAMMLGLSFLGHTAEQALGGKIHCKQRKVPKVNI